MIVCLCGLCVMSELSVLVFLPLFIFSPSLPFFPQSSTFVRFLEALTGVHDIIPDPHFRGSGLHQTTKGGKLDIHADFNRYARFGLDRRVNTFTFLNKNWDESWGGYLELWTRDMKKCAQRVAPSFNRLVVFSSTDFSYHGHPLPLEAPLHRSRRSVALYYYTNGRPDNEKDTRYGTHSTLWQTPVGCAECRACPLDLPF